MKRIALLGVGVLLVASPFFVSADSVSDLQARIQQLLGQLRMLQQQLAELQIHPPIPVAPDSRTCPAIARILTVGASGDDVSSLQAYLGVPQTGYFGPATASAVSKFQSDEGISMVGSVGPQTRAALARHCGRASVIVPSLPAEKNIQKVQAPTTVTVSAGTIVEVRNLNLYFTVTAIGAGSATLDATPVYCGNSFPSDPPPQFVCAMAILPTPPFTLHTGYSHADGRVLFTLKSVTASSATLSIEELELGQSDDSNVGIVSDSGTVSSGPSGSTEGDTGSGISGTELPPCCKNSGLPDGWHNAGELVLAPSSSARIGQYIQATAYVGGGCGGRTREAFTLDWGDGIKTGDAGLSVAGNTMCTMEYGINPMTSSHAYSKVGTYTVKLSTSGQTTTQTVVVTK